MHAIYIIVSISSVMFESFGLYQRSIACLMNNKPPKWVDMIALHQLGKQSDLLRIISTQKCMTDKEERCVVWTFVSHGCIKYHIAVGTHEWMHNKAFYLLFLENSGNCFIYLSPLGILYCFSVKRLFMVRMQDFTRINIAISL